MIAFREFWSVAQCPNGSWWQVVLLRDWYWDQHYLTYFLVIWTVGSCALDMRVFEYLSALDLGQPFTLICLDCINALASLAVSGLCLFTILLLQKWNRTFKLWRIVQIATNDLMATVHMESDWNLSKSNKKLIKLNISAKQWSLICISFHFHCPLEYS